MSACVETDTTRHVVVSSRRSNLTLLTVLGKNAYPAPEEVS
jgi:hypothetical protein